MTFTPSDAPDQYSVTAEERNQICQGHYAYCRGLDRFDRELALSPFAPDAVLRYSDVYVGDAPGFMDWVWPVHEALQLHVHRVANVFIVRNPSGSLVSEAYVQVLLRKEADGEVLDTFGYGRYIDRWEERGGRLVILERDYVRDAVRTTTAPRHDMSSVRPTTEGVELTWARDASDASYRLMTS